MKTTSSPHGIIQCTGTILKIDEPDFNKETGRLKRKFSFQPNGWKTPLNVQCHHRFVPLLSEVKEGDKVMLDFYVWPKGAGDSDAHNVVANKIEKI